MFLEMGLERWSLSLDSINERMKTIQASLRMETAGPSLTVLLLQIL
jgi:hypothetical protein